MLRAKRVKRASPTDLYKSCKLGGDCIPDVQNKIEGTTLADRLLTIFGSILYLGNLGIGTGKGSGGFGGYRPLSGTTTKAPSIPVSRPAIPIDPLGGAEIIPLDVINPEAPSIIPLVEGTPEVPAFDTVGPTTDVATLDITTPFQPTDDLPTSNQQPNIINTGSEVNIVDFQPGPTPPKRIALDVGLSTDNDIQLNVFPQAKYTDPDINVFVDPNLVGESIGFEDIELGPITSFAEFDIIEEAVPKYSTPTERLERVVTQGKRLYNRFVQQVQTRNPEFITQPSRLVRFEFENPAFEEEVTLQFEKDVNEVAAAPDSDFQDIVTLSRPIFSETEEGVRVSRLGQKASMITRSGLQIGQKVHFFYNISNIEPVKEIELPSYGSFSGESVLVNPIAESNFYDGIESISDVYPDELLEDVIEEQFQNSHLVLSTFSPRDRVQIPTFAPGIGLKVFVPDVGNLIVDYPQINIDDTVISTSIPAIPIQPDITVDIEGENFIVHPDLLRRKRKRKYIDF